MAPRQPHGLLTLTALSLALGAGCAPSVGDPETLAPAPPDARAERLIEGLIDDNSVWLDRPPHLLATKYARMADDPYDFMRGTAGVYLADADLPDSSLRQSAFLGPAGAWEVLLAGDPHPENVGTFLGAPLPEPGARSAPLPHLELGDLDGAGYGPYLADVRRANLGIVTLAADLDGCGLGCRRALAESLSLGYAEEILRRAAGAPGYDPLLETACGLPEVDLIEEAAEEGLERKRLGKYTEPGPEGHLVLRREPLDEDGDGLVEATEAEAAQVGRILASLPGLRLLDAVRRYGTGIQSLPATRYLLLVDRGEAGEADDFLLNVREVVAAPALPSMAEAAATPFSSEADRIDYASRALWYQGDADPEFRTLVDGAQSFKILSWASYYQAFDHDKIKDAWDDGDLDAHALRAMAEGLGRLLASAHGRAPTASGAPGLGPIAKALGPDPGAFAAEQGAVAVAEHGALMSDLARFQDALERLGPWLGAEDLYEAP